MSVFRVEKTKNYTVMSNHHLKDTRLSLKSKGLLSVMLSLPEEWDYTAKGLSSICKEGIDAINAAVKELEQEGYIKRTRVRNAKGQLTTTEYVIYEEPQLEESVSTPTRENPIVDRNNHSPANADITSFEPKRENPVLDKNNRKTPKLENPILEKPILENPHQLNTNILNTNKSNTIPSFIHSTDVIDSEVTSNENSEGMKVYKKICDNVNFKMLIHNNPDKIKFIVFIQSVISSVVKGDKPIKSKGQIIQNNKCIDMYLKLNGEMIIGIIDDLINCRSKIKDYFAYIASALYLAPMQDDIKREKPKNQSSFDIDEYEKFANTLDLRKGLHDQWLMDNGLNALVINSDDQGDQYTG